MCQFSLFLDIKRREILVFHRPSFLYIPVNLPPSLILCLVCCLSIYTYTLCLDIVFTYPCLTLRTTAQTASLASVGTLVQALAASHVVESDGENINLAVTTKLANEYNLRNSTAPTKLCQTSDCLRWHLSKTPTSNLAVAIDTDRQVDRFKRQKNDDGNAIDLTLSHRILNVLCLAAVSSVPTESTGEPRTSRSQAATKPQSMRASTGEQAYQVNNSRQSQSPRFPPLTPQSNAPRLEENSHIP